MKIIAVNLYNRIPAICEKAWKKVSMRNFTSHCTPGSIGSECTPTRASFQTCFEVKCGPNKGLDKWWRLIKSPMFYFDLCVFRDKELELSRKAASGFNFICHEDFLVTVSTSYQICNHRNKKVPLTKMGSFSSIVYGQQFLNGF